MAVRRRPSTARMTGAWNTLPARPNPTSPTVSMTGDCTGKAELRYGRAGARSLSRCKPHSLVALVHEEGTTRRGPWREEEGEGVRTAASRTRDDLPAHM